MTLDKRKIKLSFKTYLVLSSIILTVAFLVALSFLLLGNTSLQINTKVDDVNEAKTIRLAEKINASLNDLKNRTQYFMTNEQIIKYINIIENSDSSSYEKNQASIDLSFYLVSISEFSPAIERVHILTQRSQYESISDTVFSYPLIYEQTIPVLKPVFSDSLPQESALKEGKPLDQKFFFTGSLNEGENVLGKIYVILSDSYLSNLVEMPDGYAIVNSNNEVLINTSPVEDGTMREAAGQLTSSGALNLRNFRLYMRAVEFDNLKIIYAADTTQFYNDRKTLIRNMVISLLISLVLAMVFSNIISKRILYPLKKLINLIQKYKTKEAGDTRFISERKSAGSLQPKLFLFYIVTIFIPIMIFMGAFLINSGKTVNSYIEDSYTEIFQKSAKDLYEYLESKRSSIMAIANDSYVQRLFDPAESDEVEPYVSDNIWHQAFMGMEEDWIGIYSAEGSLLISNGLSYAEEESTARFLEKMDLLQSGIHMEVSSDRLGNDILSMGVAVRNTSDFLSIRYNTGYIKTDIRFDYLKNKMTGITDAAEAFVLIGSSGEVMYPGGSADVQPDTVYGVEIPGPPRKTLTPDGEKLIFSDYDSSLEITLVSVIDYDMMFSGSGFLLDNYILITAIVLLLIFISSYFVSRRVLVPISKVNKIFRETSLDTMHENELDDYAINEINELGSTYNSMIARIENLIDEVIVANASKNRMEQSKKEAEIISLQAQINPHFLYNTLTTINGMIKTGCKEEAIEMVNALSDLFRYGISRGEIIIGIEEEIEHAKAYANIMSFRYRDRLVFTWDIDGDAYKYSTIKLIIQPFIENSINHGVKISDKICTIQIKCEVLDESIRITVKDDGMGIEERQLALIKSHLENGSLTGKIGIFNVQSRLRLHYGADYGMDIESVYGTGTVVTIVIPKNELGD